MNESARVLVALIVALVLGAIVAATGNATLLRLADLVAPIGTVWVNAIRMTIIPLIVSLLITGVASTSDGKSIGRIGGRSLLVFGLMLVGTAIVVVPTLPAVFALLPRTTGGPPPLPQGAAEAAGQLATSGPGQSLGAWIISLVPANPIAAAATGAIVPLIVFTLLLGLAIAYSPAPSRTILVGFFKALGDALLVLVRWVIAAAPIGVFALVLPLAAHLGAGMVGAVGFYIAVYAGAALVVTALLYPVVALWARVPIARFARAVLPPQLIAASSSSSMASLPALVEGAEALGLSSRVTGFVLPLAVSTFRIAAPVSWTVGALFVAWFYGINLGPRELATLAVASIFLPFIGPGVPRGAFLMLAPLFLGIGLPAEGIGILIAVDVIPDVFSTVLNVTGDLAAAAVIQRGEPDEADVRNGSTVSARMTESPIS
jgi:Na+/H+-dicarboxylate symporter